jgi:hypothetical protein
VSLLKEKTIFEDFSLGFVGHIAIAHWYAKYAREPLSAREVGNKGKSV